MNSVVLTFGPTQGRLLGQGSRLLAAILVIYGLCALAACGAGQGSEAATAEAGEAQPSPEEAFSAIRIPNARSLSSELLTGGQPTEEDLEAAARTGFRTIVNLRPDSEPVSFDEADTVRQLKMRYISIPISGAGDLTEDNVQRFAEVVGNPGLFPMIVHCASGNRVGALFALRAHQVDGVGVESALDMGKKAGLTRLEPAVRELLGLPPAGLALAAPEDPAPD